MVSLKSSVFYSRFDGGVVFRGGSSPLILKGARSYDLVDAIVHRMDAMSDVEHLLSSLPEAVRPAANQVISSLEQHQLLRVREPDDAEAEPWIVENLGQFWNYLADAHPRPGEAMRRWSRRRFLIYGDASTQVHVARALAECGATRLHAVTTDDRPFSALREALGPLGERLDLGAGDAPSVEHEAEPPIEICAGPVDLAPAGLRDAWFCGLLNGHAVAARVPGQLGAALDQWSRALQPALAAGETAPPPPSRLALAANVLAFGLFNHVTGMEGRLNLARPHLVTPASQIVAFDPPSPVRRVGAEVALAEAPQGALEEGGSNAEALVERLAPLFAPFGGILEELEDQGRQVPLAMTKLRLMHEPESPPIVGWGLTRAEARLRAILRGVEAYVRASGILLSGEEVVVTTSKAEIDARIHAMPWSEASDAWRPARAEELSGPPAYKLWKLLGLISAVVPQVLVNVDPSAADVQVMIGGTRRGQARASLLEEALYLALGDACAALQGDTRTPTFAEQGRRWPTGAVGIERVDLGLCAVGEVLTCHLVRGRGHAQESA